VLFDLLSRETEAKILIVCTLNEVKGWIEEYREEPEKLRDFLLNRLSKFDLSMDTLSTDVFHETVKELYILDYPRCGTLLRTRSRNR